ncbi:hypothetical protein BJ742DRAFT_798082 [Cladochytrium replicatum]|nr:hypothetical protein BJ742DRAFT_798082 [Cladochytrium replicatum]
MFSHSHCLPCQIGSSIKRRTGAVALTFAQKGTESSSIDVTTLTFDEVWAYATRFAHLLSRILSGANETDQFEANREDCLEGNFLKVGVLVDGGIWLPIVMVAVFLMDPPAAIVPLDQDDPRLSYILEDAQPNIIITKDDECRAICVNAWRRAFPAAETVSHPSYITIEELRARSRKDQAPEFVCHGKHLGKVSHVYFTSGSTGRQKGCVVSHRALAQYSLAKNSIHNVTPDSVVFIASTHTFDPYLGDVVASWAAGAQIALAEKQTMLLSLDTLLSQLRVTHILSTPALFATIPSTDLPHLKVVALGGESMSQKIADTWSDRVTLINTYGVTEACVYQSAAVVSPGSNRKAIGLPFPGNELLAMTIVAGKVEDIPSTDPFNLRPVNPTTKEIGELWVAGEQVGLGYLKRPNLTRERFLTHPVYGVCFRTGDFVTYDRVREASSTSGPFLRYLGRIDGQVKVNGQRVETDEIEQSILSGAAGIINTIAVVLHSAQKLLVAFCVPEDVNSFIAEEPSEKQHRSSRVLTKLLRAIAEQNLPRHMVPSRFIFMSSIPTGRTGKVDRAVLSLYDLPSDQLLSNDESAGEEPENEHGWWTAKVRKVWSEEFKIPPSSIPADAHFLELGGDSLAAVRICQRLTEILRQSQSTMSIDSAAPLKTRSGGEEVHHMDDFSDGGSFGERLGTLSPANLLSRPELDNFARYLSGEFGALDGRISTMQTLDAKKERGASLEHLLRTSAALDLPTVVTYFLKSSPPLSFEQNSSTPLHASAANGALRATTLLTPIISPLHPDNNGVTPIQLACRGPLLILKHLLSQTTSRSPLSRVDFNRATPMHHAARGGAPVNVIEFLYEQKADPLALDVFKRTPLHWAVVNGHLATAAALLENPEAWKAVKMPDQFGEDCIAIAERRAKCGANERAAGVGANVFGAIAKLLGGSGTSKHLYSVKRATNRQT